MLTFYDNAHPPLSFSSLSSLSLPSFLPFSQTVVNVLTRCARLSSREILSAKIAPRFFSG